MIFENSIQELKSTIKAVPRNGKSVARTAYARVLKHETNWTRLTPKVLIGGIREM